MKKLLVFFLLVSVTTVFSQQETIPVSSLAQKFVKGFNAGNYHAIYALFSDGMKEKVSFEIFEKSSIGIKSKEGDIIGKRPLKNESKTKALYEIRLEEELRILAITLDSVGKIAALSFRKKTVINNLKFIKNNLNSKQIKFLYEQAKVFPNKTQIAIGFIKDDTVNFYGVERKNDEIIYKDNRKDIFEIASITKVFTATLLADFVLHKKVALNDHIDKYLNFTLHNNQKITFRDLANHTSGLPRLPTNLSSIRSPKNPYKDYSEADLKEYLTRLLVLDNSPPKFLYSNIGFALLGYTLGKVANKSYKELLKEKIFAKYGMLNSTTNLKEAEKLLISGLDRNGNPTANWERKMLEGNGAILSNVEDLSKFALAQFDEVNKELSLTRKKTFKRNEKYTIGLGWFINENNIIWHNGATTGYHSCIALDVSNNEGVIVLSNVSGGNKNKKNIESLCFGLMKI